MYTCRIVRRLLGSRTRKLLWVIVTATVIGLYILMDYLLRKTPVFNHLVDKLGMPGLYTANVSCPNCNNFQYNYLVKNGTECRPDGNVFLLMIVMSHHANVPTRNTIRQTYGRLTEYRKHRIKLVFAFGVHKDHNLNRQLKLEQASHKDIIQGQFQDSYETLTEKSIMSLTWVRDYCPQAKYVLKTDDDSFNYPQGFIDYLKTITTDKFIGGYCLTVLPDRRLGSKYYIPESIYPDLYYPVYCAGPGYIVSQGAIREIVRVAPNVRYIPMEDVFVTGFCRVTADMRYTQIPGMLINKYKFDVCSMQNGAKNAHNIVPPDMDRIWKEAEKNASQCLSLIDILMIGIIVIAIPVCASYVYCRSKKHSWKLR